MMDMKDLHLAKSMVELDLNGEKPKNPAATRMQNEQKLFR